VGLGLGLEMAVANLETFAKLSTWRDEIITKLRVLAPELVVLGEQADRLPNTISLTIPGWKRENHVIALDLAGISISAGSACSSGKVVGSKVGGALGLDEHEAIGVVRISLGWTTTRDEIDTFLDAWGTAYARVSPSLKISA
jgi:cysteine desulfurase